MVAWLIIFKNNLPKTMSLLLQRDVSTRCILTKGSRIDIKRLTLLTWLKFGKIDTTPDEAKTWFRLSRSALKMNNHRRVEIDRWLYKVRRLSRTSFVGNIFALGRFTFERILHQVHHQILTSKQIFHLKFHFIFYKKTHTIFKNIHG